MRVFISGIGRFILGSLVMVCASNALAQTDERTPPPKEDAEVKVLVAAFYNDLLKTKTLGPLIGKYFVSDVSTRLKYCGNTGNCGGFARDFWQENEELTSLGGSKADFRMQYIVNFDLLFLYSIAYYHLSEGVPENTSKNPLSHSPEGVASAIRKKLEAELVNNPAVLRLDPFANSDLPAAKTIADYRKRLRDQETFCDALRRLVTKLIRNSERRSNAVGPSDFRVYKEPSAEEFFRYPKGTWMYSVWGENELILFVTDVVREKGQLKIVAAYPPID